MKALTICQPYAEMIARREKLIENRTWYTSYRGPLAIHAGKSKSWFDEDDLIRPEQCVFGAIICMAIIYDCLPINKVRLTNYIQENPAQEIHVNGPYCWMLRDIKRVFPHEAKGQQGLWEIDYYPHIIRDNE